MEKKLNHFFFFKRIIVTFKRLPFNSIAWIIEMFHMKLCAEHLQLKVDFLHNNRAWAEEFESDSDPACCLFASSFENLIQCTIIFAKYLCKSCLLDMCTGCAGRARVLLHILFALHWNIYVEHIIVYLENTNWMRKTGLTELCREAAAPQWMEQVKCILCTLLLSCAVFFFSSFRSCLLKYS